MLKLWVSGPIPSKKNSKRICKVKGRPILLSSKNYLAWEKKAILEIKLGWEQMMIQRCESITYEFAFPDYRVRDLTNSVEGVNDALVSAGVLKDDNWRVTGTITLMGHKAENPESSGVLITFNGVEYE